MIDYLPKTSEQLLGLLYSFGIGLALGFIYELIRFIFFILSGSDKKFTLARDIIFLLLCLTVTFFFFLVRYNGKVMFYAVLGEAVGGYAAFKAVDPFVTFLVRKKLRRVRKRIIKICTAIKEKIASFVKKIQSREKNIIKDEKNSENDLHNRHDIVYNQSVTVYPLQEEIQNRGDENG